MVVLLCVCCWLFVDLCVNDLDYVFVFMVVCLIVCVKVCVFACVCMCVNCVRLCV